LTGPAAIGVFVRPVFFPAALFLPALSLPGLSLPVLFLPALFLPALFLSAFPPSAFLPFGKAFLLAFLAGAVLLADACRFTDRFALGRLAERLEAAPFLADFAGFARFAAFRLAMAESFRNLDSLAISVVLSVAYRNSGKPSGGPAPA
jgi:hypothetical protein